MEQLQHDVRQCIDLLDSTKITERRKKCSELQDFLQRQDVIALLNNNTKNKEGITWDAVLHTSHRALLKEADKIRDEDQKGGKRGPTYESAKASFSALITSITSKANSGGIQRLSIGPLLQCVLGILQEAFLRKHFGFTYMHVLRFQVLTCHNYCANINEDLWKDLLQLVEQLYRHLPQRVDKALVLSTLTLIIEKGGHHSFLALEIKKKFPFITECIKTDARIPNLQEHLARLALITCNLLKYESRMAVCKFGEEVMSDLRNMYDVRVEGPSKKKDTLLEWFTLEVAAHHPCGAKRGTPAAYAGQWDVWAKQLGWLYQLVIAEVSSIIRHKKVRHLRQNFIEFAVSVCKQMFEAGTHELLDMSMISNLNDSSLMEGNAPKRIRLETGIPALLDKLTSIQQPDMWPWLSLLSALAGSSPELITEGNMTSLLQFCADQLQTCKDVTTTENLYRCCNVLLSVEEKKNIKFLDTKRLKDLWNCVWDTSLRAVGLNLCEEGSHHLVQSLVLASKQVPVDSLLDLFVSGAIHRSKNSLSTLHVVATRFCLLERLTIKQCILLQEWVLPTREEATVDDWPSYLPCTDLIAKVLVALVIKNRAPSCSIEKLCGEVLEDNIEHDYLFTCFEGGLFTHNKCISTQTEEPKEMLFIENELVNHLMILLTRDQFTVKEKCVPGTSGAVHTLSLHCSLLFNVINTLKQWHISPGPEVLTSLEEFLDEVCDRIAEAVKGVLMNQGTMSIITPVLERLVSLFQLFSTCQIPSLNLSSLAQRLATDYVMKACARLTVVSQRTLKPLDDFDFDEVDTPVATPEEMCPFNPESIQGWCYVQLQAFKVRLEFSRWDPNTLATLLSQPFANNKEVSMTCALHMALSASRLACSLPSLPVFVLEELLILVQLLCRHWHSSDMATLAIIDLFQDMCGHVAECGDEDSRSNFIVLITGILKFVKKKKYGAHVCARFVNLLGHIALVDKAGDWSIRMADDGSFRPLAQELLFFFTSPFQQVRTTVCQNIWKLFSIPCQQQQQQVFNVLLSAVNEIYIIEGDLQAEEQLDEGVLRTATALHGLAAVAGITSKWRCKAIFNILHLAVEKNLNTDLVKKVLTVVASHLGVGSLNEMMSLMMPTILWSWHERTSSLNSFPWAVLGYDSDAHFYSNQLTSFVPVLIHRRDTTSLNQISAIIGQHVPAIVEACYPVLLGSILPCFADENQQQTATIIISIIEQYLGEEKVSALLVTKLGDVLVNLVGNLYDQESLKSLCDAELGEFPEVSKFAFTTDLILGGFRYIQENSPKSDIPLLVYLSQEKPRLIQKVLLKLYTKVYLTKLPEYKLLFLHQFVSLCDIVASVVITPQYKLSRYSICWLVRMLLHLMSGASNTGLLAASYLHRFLATILPSMADVVDLLLPDLVTPLVPHALLNTEFGRKVLKVLELLLITHVDVLPSVAMLDPLPSEPRFDGMTQHYHIKRYAAPLSHTLQAEIQHVLNTGYHTTRSQGLKHLRTQLSEKKTELFGLYKDLQETRGFSEDCEQSILHRLICLLIKIALGPDPKAAYEAVCCLGELGPADLTTLGLKPDMSVPSLDPLELFLDTALKQLGQYLFDADILLVQAASDALYALFANFGQQIISKLSRDQTELFHPFITNSKKQRRPLTVDENALSTVMEMFCPDELILHKQWITRLITAIFNSSQLGFLVPVCNFKEEFCDELFPLITDAVLQTSNKKAFITQLFIVQINEFFNRHDVCTASDEIYKDRDTVLSMLKLVQVVKKNTDQPRQINYLHVSKAALFCSAYFTSVMYAELWASETNSDREDLNNEGVSQLEFIEERDNESGQLLQNLLREAYMKIGEPDAVYGCGNSHLLDQQTQIQHYQYEGKWTKVVEACDLQLSLDSPHHLSGFGTALNYCGLNHLASKASERLNYEASWRLCQWECPEPMEQSHDGLVYSALRTLLDTDKDRVMKLVDCARGLVIQSLTNTSLEAATNIYTPLSQLRALQEIEDFATKDFQSVAFKWEQQDKIGWNKFTQVETILAQRVTMLKIKKDLDQERSVKLVVSASEAAKTEGFHTVAHRWLVSHASQHNLAPHLQEEVQLLQAQLYWVKQETDMARHVLRRLLARLKESDHKTLYAKALHTFGSLVARTRTEQAQQVLDKYLIPAVESADEDFRLVAANSLARYADSEYETLLNYVKSSAYTSKMKSISESLSSAQKLSKSAEVTKLLKSNDVDRQTKMDVQKTINMHDKQSKIDQTEVENAQRELDNFLILAIRHYIMSLKMGDANNLCIFRVVSLWLNNYDNNDVQEELSHHLNHVPSYKFLPVLPQLAARICDRATDMSTILLHNLIERCAKDHPHHVLPLVMALANSYKDSEYSQTSLSNSSKPEARVVGAQSMLAKLRHRDPLKTLIKDMQTVAEAYISLANCPHNPDKASKVYKIPKSEPITKLKAMSNVLCPTVTLPVRKSGNYTEVVGINGFDETYYSVGGINVPKKIMCKCSDGQKRPQLVKGNDDLRQDAVMQQVFTIMNSLLRENKETLKRRLIIRTYKVVPLSRRSGVIEWCSNTTPLSTYLVGGGGVTGAHTRYRKDIDWSPTVCRHKLADVAKTHNNAKKLEVFKEICANFKPVFRHFFFEKFPNPGILFERKLAYTHSVATTSMVGYILGLGDRHILNILIDERTAEVIHIDFGIAFEQGRTLATSETVPFRLTRDIIDGMGVSGIEGVFRRSCEKTMEVLRECQSTIVTILEVLLYDPLYMWTITPAMAIAKQANRASPSQSSTQAPEEGQVNKLAERALLRLKQKLQGIEEGSTTSVEGQVSKLIQEATNPVNLSRLFHGWQAHV